MPAAAWAGARVHDVRRTVRAARECTLHRRLVWVACLAAVGIGGDRSCASAAALGNCRQNGCGTQSSTFVQVLTEAGARNASFTNVTSLRVRVGTALASLRRVVVVPRLINPNASGYSDGGATQVPYTMKDSCPAIAVVPDQFYVRQSPVLPTPIQPQQVVTGTIAPAH